MSATKALAGDSQTAKNVIGKKGVSINILAIAAFIIVTTEFLIVGLLPAIARDLAVSVVTVGQLVTLFALVVMLAGPFLTAMLVNFERKSLFIFILLLFAVSNALAAVAPNIWVLALARFIPALALPVFWGTASETAAQLANPSQEGKAVAKVYLGISAAMLLGIPLGTLAADVIGWRGAFALLAGMSCFTALLMHLFMPSVQKNTSIAVNTQIKILKSPYFISNLLLSIVIFTAMFSGYTYLAEFLEKTVKVAPTQVGWWLMGFGAIGLLGNWLGGLWVDKKPLFTTAVFSFVMALGMIAAMLFAHDKVVFAVALAVWGIANTALYPICQIRVMKAASGAQALAGSLNVSAANGGIAFGAMLGGLSITTLGIEVIGYVAASIAIIAICFIPIVAKLRHG